MKTIKRQQRTIGAIIKVPLENGYHTYARILETRLAFYDARTKKEFDIKEIINKSILFTIVVYDEVITNGYWLKVGKKLPIEQRAEFNKPVFTENILTNKYWIYTNKEKIEATKEQVAGMESYQIWGNEDVEIRLNDYYANRKNDYIEDMKNSSPISGMIKRALLRKKELTTGL